MSSGRGRSPCDTGPREQRLDVIQRGGSGQSIKVLQARLGHKSAVETWDTYGHLMGDGDDRSRAIIQEALGNVVHSSSTVSPL
jgi:hypothetical protein